MVWRIGVCAATWMLAALIAAGPVLAWGAIAVSGVSARGWGYSYGYPNEGEARAEALRRCGRGCKVVVTFRHGCAAYAYGYVSKNDYEFGIGKGRTRKAAENEALDECEYMLWDECEIKVWACN